MANNTELTKTETCCSTETCEDAAVATSATATSCEHATSDPVAVERIRPAVNIQESRDAVILTADVPGVDESNVDLEVDKGVLTLRARRTFPEWNSDRRGRKRTVEYVRSFRLSDELATDLAEASVSHGVLELRFPKKPEAVATKISVKAGT